MKDGTVKWFDQEKGYGFIQQKEDEDVFFHQSNIRENGEGLPGEGDRVQFVPEQTEKGLAAEQVLLRNGNAQETVSASDQDVASDTSSEASSSVTFEELGIEEPALRGVEAAGFDAPRPIQEKAIPPIIEGRNLVGNAPTGTGKTAAFLLPMIQFMSGTTNDHPRGLILAPTHELAEQITEEARTLGEHTNLTIDSVYGGTSVHGDKERLEEGVDLLVACPGRLLDHMNRNNVDLNNVQYFVLDEADRMCDMGFLPDIKNILRWLPNEDRQSMFFSATIPPEIQQLADEMMDDPVRVEIGQQAPTSTVSHYVIEVKNNQKEEALKTLLRDLDIESGLIFCRTRNTVKSLAKTLRKQEFDSCALQGGMDSLARDATLDAFRRQRFTLLVATNVAARGLDVEHISHVINYDIPEDPDVYTHRLGRTGRSGKEGAAYTLVTPQDRGDLKDIENVIGYQIDRKELS